MKKGYVFLYLAAGACDLALLRLSSMYARREVTGAINTHDIPFMFCVDGIWINSCPCAPILLRHASS
jgi:hypothetical protein